MPAFKQKERASEQDDLSTVEDTPVTVKPTQVADKAEQNTCESTARARRADSRQECIHTYLVAGILLLFLSKLASRSGFY